MSYGGGGFDENATSSQQTPTKPRRDYDAQTLIPVTVKMLLSALSSPSGTDAAGDMMLSDGRPLHMVKLVGAVRSVETRSTNTFLDIEDGTGLFSVKVYSGGREDGGDGDPSGLARMKDAAFNDAQYVRMIGQLKEFDGSRSLIANDVRVLSCGDELTHHFLEVAYSYEKWLKRQQEQGQQQQGGGQFGFGIGNMASGGGGPRPMHGGNVISPGGGMGGGNGGGEGGNPINEAVLNIIKEQGGEGTNEGMGISVNDIKQQLSGRGFGDADISNALLNLSNEGLIYSTIDENHYSYAQ